MDEKAARSDEISQDAPETGADAASGEQGAEQESGSGLSDDAPEGEGAGDQAPPESVQDEMTEGGAVDPSPTGSE